MKNSIVAGHFFSIVISAIVISPVSWFLLTMWTFLGLLLLFLPVFGFTMASFFLQHYAGVPLIEYISPLYFGEEKFVLAAYLTSLIFLALVYIGFFEDYFFGQMYANPPSVFQDFPKTSASFVMASFIGIWFFLINQYELAYFVHRAISAVSTSFYSNGRIGYESVALILTYTTIIGCLWHTVASYFSGKPVVEELFYR